MDLIRSSFLWLPAGAIRAEPGSGGKAALPLQPAPVFACCYRLFSQANKQGLEEGRKEDSLNLVPREAVSPSMRMLHAIARDKPEDVLIIEKSKLMD